MKRLFSAMIITATVFTACNSKSEETTTTGKDSATTTTPTTTPEPSTPAADQSTPKAVADILFAAAQSGDYSKLTGLCDASLEPDGDSKDICNVATGDDKLKASFKEYFSKGTVVGEPVIEGDNAKVEILFGPDGSKKETLNMSKKDGKWYLVSF